jgi:preprotein translocase SecE subunit
MRIKNLLRRVGVFFGETAGELRKASWPNQKEMRHYVGVVLVGMAILGVYVAIVDFALLHVMELCSDWARGSLGQ